MGKTYQGKEPPYWHLVHPHAGGENSFCSLTVSFWPVHPHAGGENSSSNVEGNAVNGSPPRGWGKRSGRQGDAFQSRFTPTRVGKTKWTVSEEGAGAVHPHAGGENTHRSAAASLHRGSPPRGWGKLALWLIANGNTRFTPTRVGKTDWDPAIHLLDPVHPHAGGENYRLPQRLRYATRFTPTRVGKTRYVHPGLRKHSVHPHAGGENYKGVSIFADVNGSPPRGWGKRYESHTS